MPMQFRLRELFPSASNGQTVDVKDYPPGTYITIMHTKNAPQGILQTWSGAVLEWRNTTTGPTDWQQVPYEPLKK